MTSAFSRQNVLVFGLLLSVLQSQTCLLLQVSLDFLLLQSNPLWWKGHLFLLLLLLVLEGLGGLHRTIRLQHLQHERLEHRLGLLWCWTEITLSFLRLFLFHALISVFVFLMSCSLYHYTLSVFVACWLFLAEAYFVCCDGRCCCSAFVLTALCSLLSSVRPLWACICPESWDQSPRGSIYLASHSVSFDW